jgi:hypothetical protein
LNEFFPLQFDVGLLGLKPFVEGLLGLHRRAVVVRVQVRHVREAHPKLRRGSVQRKRIASPWDLKAFCLVKIGLEHLRHVFKLRPEKLLNSLNAPKLLKQVLA